MTYRRELIGNAGKSLALAPLVILWCLHGSAQTTQLLPEIDTNVKLSSDLRVSFQAKGTREGGAPEQAEIGHSLDFYLKPLIHFDELLARSIVVFCVFIPFFAFRELRRVLGESRFHALLSGRKKWTG